MSQTIAAPYPTLTVTTTFNDNVYYSLVRQVREGFVIVGVLCGLYGVLIVLSVLSINALMQRSRRIPPTAIVLSSAILILFASTTIYMIAAILFYLSQFLINLIAADLYTDGDDVVDLVPEYLVKDYSPLRACASTATLTVNVVLGDAIVCWRACVVWHQDRYVKAFCGLFLLATTILGAVNTALGCGPEAFYKSFDLNTGIPQGTMFEGLPIGIAACVLSLSTNILATALVGQKEVAAAPQEILCGRSSRISSGKTLLASHRVGRSVLCYLDCCRSVPGPHVQAGYVAVIEPHGRCIQIPGRLRHIPEWRPRACDCHIPDSHHRHRGPEQVAHREGDHAAHGLPPDAPHRCCYYCLGHHRRRQHSSPPVPWEWEWS